MNRATGVETMTVPSLQMRKFTFRERIIWLAGAKPGLEPGPSDTIAQLAWGRGGGQARTQMLKIQHEYVL